MENFFTVICRRSLKMLDFVTTHDVALPSTAKTKKTLAARAARLFFLIRNEQMVFIDLFQNDGQINILFFLRLIGLINLAAMGKTFKPKVRPVGLININAKE